MYLLYYFILYYFSFFYLFKIYTIGNFALISGVKEVLILILFFLLIIKKKRAMSDKSNNFKISRSKLVLILFYVSSLIIASIKTHSLLYIFIDGKYYLIWPLFAYITYKMFKNKANVSKLVLHINIICIVISIMGYYYYVTDNYEFLRRRSALDVYAIQSILSTHIDFGALLVLGTMFNILDIKVNGIRKRSLILIAAYTYLTYLCYSRSIYIAYIVMLYLFIHISFFNKIKNRSQRIFIKIIGASIILVSCMVISNSIDIDSSNILSIDSLKDRIQRTWPSLQTNSAILGLGFGAVGGSSNASSIYYVSDNNYLRFFLNLGLYGIAIIFLVLRKIYHEAKNRELFKVAYWSIGVACIFTDFFTLTPAMIMVYMWFGLSYGISIPSMKTGVNGE